MRRLGLLVFAACVQPHSAALTFGADGEGLDGFLCKDTTGKMVLDWLGGSPDAGAATATAYLVADMVRLSGVPGCRTGQLVQWCSEHVCEPISSTRTCFPIELPTGVTGMEREAVRDLVREALKSISGKEITKDAPDEFVMLRVIATAQSCESLGAGDFDVMQLVGCAYSCPTLFDKVEQDVYLGFDGLDGVCEKGLRTCADHALHWAP